MALVGHHRAVNFAWEIASSTAKRGPFKTVIESFSPHLVHLSSELNASFWGCQKKPHFIFVGQFGHVRWWHSAKKNITKSPAKKIQLFLGSPCSCPMIATPSSFTCGGRTNLNWRKNARFSGESLITHGSAFFAAKVSGNKSTFLELQLFWRVVLWKTHTHFSSLFHLVDLGIWGIKSANSMTSRFRNFGVAPTHHVVFAEPFDVLTQMLGPNFVPIVKVVSFQYLGVFFFGGMTWNNPRYIRMYYVYVYFHTYILYDYIYSINWGGLGGLLCCFFLALQNLFPKNPRKNSAASMATCQDTMVQQGGGGLVLVIPKNSPSGEFWRLKVNKKVLFFEGYG